MIKYFWRENSNIKKSIQSEVTLCLAWKFNSDILSQFQNTTKSKWNSVGKTLVGIAVWTENQKTRLKLSENIDLKAVENNTEKTSSLQARAMTKIRLKILPIENESYNTWICLEKKTSVLRNYKGWFVMFKIFQEFGHYWPLTSHVQEWSKMTKNDQVWPQHKNIRFTVLKRTNFEKL